MFHPVLSRGRGRVVAAAVAAAALGGALLAPPAAAAPPADLAAVPDVSWTECRDGFQCAAVPVPLDHGDPEGAQIDISVVRLPAGDPAQRIGSLLLNPGGPGGSGVEFARAIADLLPLELRARYDIVGFDPRGINLSTPLRCFETFDQVLAILPPFAFPDTPDEEEAQRLFDDQLSAACGRNGGPILDHMSSADAARDMDVLREVLGDEELNYLGFSYGSVLGQNYANLFPSRVGAFVIDAVVDPIAWSTGYGQDGETTPFETRIESADGSQRTLEEFFRLCDEAGPDCVLAGDASGRFTALAERLRAQPMTTVDPVTGETFAFTYQDLIAVTLGALYSPIIWPDLAQFVADLELQVGSEVLGQRLAAIRTGLGLEAAAQEEYPNFIEGPTGVACSDTVNPRSFEAWQAAADRAEEAYGPFGRLWNWSFSACASWPATAGQDRHLGPWTADTASPVLIVGNEFDPSTPYQGAVAASELLPNSRLLTYGGWGHAGFFAAGNFCVDTAVTRYLVSGELPEEGTVCAPEGSPFGPTSALTARDAAAAAAVHAGAVPPSVRRALHGR
jgi:pimeloyl-ACP methyl ester carboxylesterase